MDAKLEGTVILIFGTPERQTRVELYEEIQKLGGETSIIFSPKRTTHVVVTNDFFESSFTQGLFFFSSLLLLLLLLLFFCSRF